MLEPLKEPSILEPLKIIFVDHGNKKVYILLQLASNSVPFNKLHNL